MMKHGWFWLAAIFVMIGVSAPAAGAAEMVLARDGVCLAPVVVPEGAPAATVKAAEDLAVYLEKITGSRPPLLTGDPQPVPESAVWVGCQPRLTDLFSELDFNFTRPEEMLIACDGRHLVIAGRDEVIGETQVEHGTANAVYTFIQKYLGVRRLWPGELGEDIVKSADISLAPFEYRFQPPFRQRAIFVHQYRADRTGPDMADWMLFQRLKHHSLVTSSGHAFKEWWDAYHEQHPDYFALQPDGTRSGFPGPTTAKLCESNPAVWTQWLENTAAALDANPALKVFNAAPNDGSNAGLCVCADCRAWDHPDGVPRQYAWQGAAGEMPAVSDRYVTFWNHLGRLLKERFPGRELFVSGFAYGPAAPAPVEAVPDDNVVIGFVGHFPMASGENRTREKAEWARWATKARNLVYRPNLFYYSGGCHALPALTLRKTAEDFRFLAEHGGVGLNIDCTQWHWATQGPQYYLMVQLAWDPLQDPGAVMDEYYRRAFGPAADKVRAYFALFEEAHDAVVEHPGFRNAMGNVRQGLTRILLETFTPDLLERAGTLLGEADACAAGGQEIYRQRLEFVRTGFDFTRSLVETMAAMTLVRESGGRDAEALKRAIELCDARDEILKRYGGLAVNGELFNQWNRSRNLLDYLGPPSAEFRKAAGLE